jgi:hypothetical protein
VADFKWHIIDDNIPFEIQDTGIWIQPFSGKHAVTSLIRWHFDIDTVHHGRMPATSSSGRSVPSKDNVTQPYLCYAFKVADKVVYISDVSHIPEDKWPIIESNRPDDSSPLPVLVLDCLRLLPNISHIGIGNAVETARRVGASRTYLTGFGHEVMHEEYVTIGEVVGGAVKDVEQLTETAKKGLALIQEGRSLWLRPAHDGLRVFVEADGDVCDETYA